MGRAGPNSVRAGAFCLSYAHLDGGARCLPRSAGGQTGPRGGQIGRAADTGPADSTGGSVAVATTGSTGGSVAVTGPASCSVSATVGTAGSTVGSVAVA